MPFFRGATDIVISGGDFNDISGNLVVNDTSERISNFRSHNTDDVVEVDSSNTSWARHGGQARSTRRPASREDTLPVYDNPNNFPTGTHTQAPVATAASAPTSTPTQQPAEVDSRRAPSRANTMASDETDNDNDRMEE
ncbi:uncharacterized protein LACBIDRAFT_296726 [Laccaria bicolor S238N-H82]|uniref:Predicted protein n=1 Tax=Laccaria bicolor (strain S238N-H82 / ATCC MYA-4686) TaxID=486041 RepID=B0D858_LACBS|nr:uncharacterized protein LACBIDRAFT_296726 [Laccaria bicolor S238N-H82]EDR09021.1 predicted protein [Laccaria bicolor S238N-H82]|eukprot:XP_001880334.1 predicted protein [Laccaria bicolor S238N-H82]